MSPGTNSHPREASPRESSRQLEGEIALLREELGGLVAELDRRRHELMDIRLQARRHALGAALTGVGLLASAAGFVWLGAWRARRRRTAMARLGRLREAVSRMVERPERVATERGIPAKIFTTAASAAAAAAIKKVLERGLQYALGSRANSTPAGRNPPIRRLDARGRTVPDA
jgi:hypothetical protein